MAVVEPSRLEFLQRMGHGTDREGADSAAEAMSSLYILSGSLWTFSSRKGQKLRISCAIGHVGCHDFFSHRSHSMKVTTPWHLLL